MDAYLQYLPYLVWALGFFVGLGPTTHLVRTFRFTLPHTLGLHRRGLLSDDERRQILSVSRLSLILDVILVGCSEYAALHLSDQAVGFALAIVAGLLVRFGTTGHSEANRREWFKGHFARLSYSSIEKLDMVMARPVVR
jgi:hypothetical protein